MSAATVSQALADIVNYVSPGDDAELAAMLEEGRAALAAEALKAAGVQS